MPSTLKQKAKLKNHLFFKYTIIGTGSSGCIAAKVLAEKGYKVMTLNNFSLALEGKSCLQIYNYRNFLQYNHRILIYDI